MPKPSYTLNPISAAPETLLGGSWDLVSKVISTLIGVISGKMYSYLLIPNPPVQVVTFSAVMLCHFAQREARAPYVEAVRLA